VTVELRFPMSRYCAQKQVLNTLLAGPVDTELRTLPPDAALWLFICCRMEPAIADFSEALATSIPSGIEERETDGGRLHREDVGRRTCRKCGG